jgi:geranylgeranyl reductase family protein
MAGGGARDVIVVGGGPAGSATAVILKQRGHDVLLLDEARFPRDKVCGEGVSPEAWRLLAAIGVDGAVRSLSPHPLRGMAVTAPDGSCFRGDYRGASQPGFAVRRERFDGVLLDRARDAGVEVREGMRATGLLQRGGAVEGVVTVNGAGPDELRARLVIGADGRRSVVARRLGLLREHRRLRKFAVRGYWDGMEGLEERGEMHGGGGGYCGVAPLSATCANVTFVLDRREMAAAGGGLEGFYRRTLRRWPRIAERLERAILLSSPKAIGPLALEASRVSAPGALLVGDAAGFYDPFTGEGVTLALRSAVLAAEVAHRCLREAPLRAFRGLRDYDRVRHAATRHKFRFNRLLQVVIGRPWLANAAVRRLARRPDLADRMVSIAGDFVPARTALGPGFLLDLLSS